MVHRGEIAEHLARRAVDDVQRHAGRAWNRRIGIFGFSALKRFVVQGKLDVHSRARTMHLARCRRNCG